MTLPVDKANIMDVPETRYVSEIMNSDYTTHSSHDVLTM